MGKDDIYVVTDGQTTSLIIGDKLAVSYRTVALRGSISEAAMRQSADRFNVEHKRSNTSDDMTYRFVSCGELVECRIVHNPDDNGSRGGARGDARGRDYKRDEFSTGGKSKSTTPLVNTVINQ